MFKNNVTYFLKEKNPDVHWCIDYLIVQNSGKIVRLDARLHADLFHVGKNYQLKIPNTFNNNICANKTLISCPGSGIGLQNCT